MIAQEDIRLTELTLKAFDEVIEPDEFDELNELLKSDANAVVRYLGLIELFEAMPDKVAQGRAMHQKESGLTDSFFDDFLRHALRRMEQQGEAIELPRISESHDRSQNPRLLWVPWAQRVRSWVAMASAAALIVLFFTGAIRHWLAPSPVATLGQTLDARWVFNDTETSSPANDPVEGARLYEGPRLWNLAKGFAQLDFDSGAAVIVEGPATFRLISDEQMELVRGRAVLHAGENVEGFRILTPGALVTDLGTEVGMEVEQDGTLAAHMLEGVACVESLPGKGRHEARCIEAGHALRVQKDTGAMEEIKLATGHFARHIDGHSGLVWRGEALSLADIVGGGNGLGTGRLGSMISAQTGSWVSQSPLRFTDWQKASELTDHEFHPVPTNPLIDGAFIPDGSLDPVVVSSLNHRFTNCPATSGTSWGGIIYVEKVINRDILLNGEKYGTEDRPALFMHANVGITFDLDQIRGLVSTQELQEFLAISGMAESYPHNADREPYGDFWVLVDGEVRYSRQGVRPSDIDEVRVPLTPNDRFLTLVVTDGGEDPANAKEFESRTSFNDWGVFALPRLQFRNGD